MSYEIKNCNMLNDDTEPSLINTNKLLLKVCGMKFSHNIVDLVALRPNFIGFIFYPKSPRFVETLDIDMLNYLPSSIKKIAVFVNERSDTVLSIIAKYKFDGVQLHGNESPEMCNMFREKGLVVLKAFSVAESSDFSKTENYEGVCDYFLFDTKTNAYGGSGQKFDWSLLDNYKGQTPFVLSGGINLHDVSHLLKIDHPHFAGIDLNSKFELEPGLKDISKLQNFFEKLNYKM